MIVVGFDPGLTTGICVFEQDGDDAKPMAYDNVHFLRILDYLENMPVPAVVIIEDFQLLPHKAMKLAGSKFETIQAIGMIMAYAHKHKAEMHKQSPTIKKVAEKLTQTPPPKNHATGHWVDAYNHAMYWMIKNGKAKTALERLAEK